MASRLVSVVIPSFNHASFVEAAIDSVLRQTTPDLELVVIDDGSVDDSVERIQEKLKPLGENGRVYFNARSNNRGLCRTLNEGLTRARGVFFAYLGSDDLWEPQKLEKQICALEAEGRNAGAAFSDCYIIDQEGNRTDRFGRQYSFRGGDIYGDLLKMKFHPASPTNLFVRQKLVNAGGFNEAIRIEDRDVWLRVARYYRIAYVDVPLASFRVHKGNTSTTDIDVMFESNQSTLDWVFRTDPSLRSWRRLILAQLAAGHAADYYSTLDLRRARKEALRSLQLNPLNQLSWRVFSRSLLGRRFVDGLRRAIRSRRIQEGIAN